MIGIDDSNTAKLSALLSKFRTTKARIKAIHDPATAVLRAASLASFWTALAP